MDIRVLRKAGSKRVSQRSAVQPSSGGKIEVGNPLGVGSTVRDNGLDQPKESLLRAEASPCGLARLKMPCTSLGLIRYAVVITNKKKKW
jgi:hypothetical protein